MRKVLWYIAGIILIGYIVSVLTVNNPWAVIPTSIGLALYANKSVYFIIGIALAFLFKTYFIPILLIIVLFGTIIMFYMQLKKDRVEF